MWWHRCRCDLTAARKKTNQCAIIIDKRVLLHYIYIYHHQWQLLLLFQWTKSINAVLLTNTIIIIIIIITSAIYISVYININKYIRIYIYIYIPMPITISIDRFMENTISGNNFTMYTAQTIRHLHIFPETKRKKQLVDGNREFWESDSASADSIGCCHEMVWWGVGREGWGGGGTGEIWGDGIFRGQN